MMAKDTVQTLSLAPKTDDVEASCAALSLSSFYIPTKFRTRLSRRRRPNSVPSETDGDEKVLSSGGKSEISKSIRSVSYDETLVKNKEGIKVSLKEVKTPKSELVSDTKGPELPTASPLERSPLVSPGNPTRKNSKMRKMSDKFQLKLLGRKVSKDKISAPTLIMASSNVKAFAIENPAKELSYTQRLKDTSASHKSSKTRSNDSFSLKPSAGTQLAREILNTPPIRTGSAKDQVRALTLATLNEYSNQQRPDIDTIGNLSAAPECELASNLPTTPCDLALSHDAESLLQFLTSKTQEDMYRMSIYDLYDYASEEEDNDMIDDLEFDLSKMMQGSSSPSTILAQSGGLNSLVEDLPKAGLTTCN
ncbi:hypothetical protein K493DRAFT_32313 [Basidiobolus meristosporus CBS 931.73]|uniref:Uncharacterized protein n=1 Tax=Basidiobolus meristosporus CBS 931.73 TaxID=1314790 RepID=A0A1Y1Y8Q1_9FUNG|nr:hypothetical protein K493DRAFT_32313 [Basidiobolus meristosporus CBS 931.73]|eukprot:ORX94116.1 hypothetical protein K493DRAFT_32313 [Basidiobolus meristosporus CBS 931.73]